MKTKENNTKSIALYIIRMCKTNNKSLEYALNIVCWYSMTEEQDKEIENHICNLWSITKGVRINHLSPINK